MPQFHDISNYNLPIVPCFSLASRLKAAGTKLSCFDSLIHLLFLKIRVRS